MQNAMRRQVFILFTIIFWILFVLGGYYYYHKPIKLEMLAAPLSALLDVLFAFLFAGLAGGLGRRILKAESIPPLERSTIQFALGAGVLSLLWLGLGVAGLYRLPLGILVLVAGLIIFWLEARAWYSQYQAVKTAWNCAAGLERILAVLAVILVAYQLLLALAPPIKWDALDYHLQLPRQFLAAGRLVFVPENPYWGHPELVEMLYTFAMSFHRPETAAVLGWSAGVVFLLGLVGFTNTQLARLQDKDEMPSTNAGWMALAAVLSGYTFRFMLGWSYTDLFSALFGLAALIVFFEWLAERRAAWMLWSGVFCGLALGTKWTAGVLALGIFTAALAFRRRAGLAWKTWLLAGMLTFVAVSPWLAKNLIVTGTPLYPYVFATPWFDAARLASANPPAETVDWWLHLFLPITTTWAGVDSGGGFSTDLGPLLLLFAAPGFWRYRRSPLTQTLGILLVFAALSLAIASLRFTLLMQTRLYFVLLPCLALPAGWGWDWLQRQVILGVRLRRILSAVVLLVLGLALWQDSYFLSQVTPTKVFLGTMTRQAYLENTLSFHIRGAQALENLPAGSFTLLLWEPRALYFPLNTRADPWIDRWRTDRRELQTAPSILEHWRKQGYTHAMFYLRGIELIRPQRGQEPTADWIVLQDLLDLLPAPTNIGDLYQLYTLQNE